MQVLPCPQDNTVSIKNECAKRVRSVSPLEAESRGRLEREHISIKLQVGLRVVLRPNQILVMVVRKNLCLRHARSGICADVEIKERYQLCRLTKTAVHERTAPTLTVACRITLIPARSAIAGWSHVSRTPTLTTAHRMLPRTRYKSNSAM